MSKLSYSYGTQPELVELENQNESYVRTIQDKIFNGLELFSPYIISQRQIGQSQDFINAISNLIYYYCTFSKGYKTLGEEYTNLLSFNKADLDQYRTKLTNGRKYKYLLLASFGQYFLAKLFKEKYNSLHFQGQSLNLNQIQGLMKYILIIFKNLPEFQTLIQKFFQLHLALFFSTGNFNSFSARLTNVSYIFAGASSTHGINYQKIGYLMITKMLIEFAEFFNKLFKDMFERQNNENNNQLGSIIPESQEEESSFQYKCGICQNTCEFPTITPCGHLFCWNCILQSAQLKFECPLCKMEFQLNKLIQLRTL